MSRPDLDIAFRYRPRFPWMRRPAAVRVGEEETGYVFSTDGVMLIARPAPSANPTLGTMQLAIAESIIARALHSARPLSSAELDELAEVQGDESCDMCRGTTLRRIYDAICAFNLRCTLCWDEYRRARFFGGAEMSAARVRLGVLALGLDAGLRGGTSTETARDLKTNELVSSECLFLVHPDGSVFALMGFGDPADIDDGEEDLEEAPTDRAPAPHDAPAIGEAS